MPAPDREEDIRAIRVRIAYRLGGLGRQSSKVPLSLFDADAALEPRPLFVAINGAPANGSRIQLCACCPRRLEDPRLCLGDSLELPCKTTEQSFPKRCSSPLILLGLPASLGSARLGVVQTQRCFLTYGSRMLKGVLATLHMASTSRRTARPSQPI